MLLARTLSTSILEGSGLPVAGEVSWLRSHASMAERSYVWPSMVKTGSVISSLVIGQTSDEATMPASASACSAERSSSALPGLRTWSGSAA